MSGWVNVKTCFLVENKTKCHNLSSADLAPRVAKIQLDPELDQVHVQGSCKKFCHWV